jgi:hypothetical protein
LAQVVTLLTCCSSVLLDSYLDSTSILTWPLCRTFFSIRYSKFTYHLLAYLASDADCHKTRNTLLYLCMVVILKQPHPSQLKVISFFIRINVSLSSVTDYLHRQGSKGKMDRFTTMMILRNRGGMYILFTLTFTWPAFTYVKAYKKMALKIHFIYLGTNKIYCITRVLISPNCPLFHNVIFISLNSIQVFFTNSALAGSLKG